MGATTYVIRDPASEIACAPQKRANGRSRSSVPGGTSFDRTARPMARRAYASDQADAGDSADLVDRRDAGEREAHAVVPKRRHALPDGGGEDLLRRALDQRPHLAVDGHDLAKR